MSMNEYVNANNSGDVRCETLRLTPIVELSFIFSKM